MANCKFTLSLIISAGTSVNGPVFLFCRDVLNDETLDARKKILKKVSTAWFKKEFSEITGTDSCAEIFEQARSSVLRKEKSAFIPKRKPETEFKDSKAQPIPMRKCGSLKVESSKLFDENMDLKRGYTTAIYDSLTKTPLKCMPVIKSKYTSKDVFNSKIHCAYGHCKFPNCLKFTIFFLDIYNDFTTIDVFSSGEFNVEAHQTLAFRRPIRGAKREEIGSLLQKKTAKTVQNILVHQEVKERNENGSIDFLASLPTLRKIKQEIREEGDQEKDDIRDIEELAKDLESKKPTQNDPHPQYVRQICSLPFHCVWYCDWQVKSLNDVTNTSLYFDATGTVVRKSKSVPFIS